ncbi:insulinase family protein [Paracoccus sp. S-4012]|uniref:M16 family metallopeptidase n=1 Tax=Paracoccus sp. S-4012 TaxID=2665648 RepID=UPI0012AF861E|nr:pitrilysin family protein [Paracoccus sp. S-4012]MRX49793.1 insulinase family protein [Paracoccus sp. S-4012]
MRPLLAALLLTPAAALAEMPPGVSHFTLPNGLEAVVIEDHRAPVVVQMLWYRIGSADEAPGESGIAHYLEHLMFKGTEKLAAGELSRTVAANGGIDNAFTSYDYTTYFQRIASDRLDLVMGMEADRMANLRISQDDWLTERDVVIEERAQRTDSDPAALFSEERTAAQFLNHPYGRPVIGWKHEAEALTREDALAWYDAHYGPDDAILVVAGDVTAEEVRQLAEAHYGPIPPKDRDGRPERPQEPPQRAPRRLQMEDPRVAQPVMVRTILAPERNAGDQREAAALTVLAALLGGSQQTSVLGRGLVLEGTALHAGAGYDGTSLDPTTFRFSLVPVPGVAPEEAEAKLDAVLAEFVAEGPDPEQMERVRVQVRAQEVYDQDSAHGRAYDYGMGLATGLTVEDVNAWPDLLAEVTPDEVQEAARALIASPASVTGWLLPGPADVPASGADPLPEPAPVVVAGAVTGPLPPQDTSGRTVPPTAPPPDALIPDDAAAQPEAEEVQK